MNIAATDFDMALSKAFDHWAPSYEQEALEKIRLRGYSYDALGRMIADDLIRYGGNNFVVEIGCGPGTLGKRLKRFNTEPIGTLVGVDISAEMLKQSEHADVYDNLVLCPADKYEFPVETTAVVSSFAFHSVENLTTLLRNIKTLPNLRLIEVVDLYPASEKELLSCRKHSEQYEHGSPERYLTIEDFCSLVTSEELHIAEQLKLGISKDYNHWRTVILERKD